MNFAGNFYSNPELLLPGVADRQMLQPMCDMMPISPPHALQSRCDTTCMYHKLADAIRQFDAVHLILFQGVTWEVVLPVGERCVSMLCPCIHCHP